MSKEVKKLEKTQVIAWIKAKEKELESKKEDRFKSWPTRSLEARKFLEKLGNIDTYNQYTLWACVLTRNKVYSHILSSVPAEIRKEYLRSRRKRLNYVEMHNEMLKFALETGIIDEGIYNLLLKKKRK